MSLVSVSGSRVDAVIAVGLDGVICAWNATAERLYGYCAARAIGEPYELIVPRARRARERMLVAETLRGSPAGEFAAERLREDGTVL